MSKKVNQGGFHSGKRLKLARELRELTQLFLVVEEGFPCNNERTLSRWESQGIPPRSIPRVAKYFQVHSNLFLDGNITEKKLKKHFRGDNLEVEIQEKRKELREEITKQVEENKEYFEDTAISQIEVSLISIYKEKADCSGDSGNDKAKFILDFSKEALEEDVSRQPRGQGEWSEVFLEAMKIFKSRLQSEIRQKDLVFQGHAWLSFWMALGYVFVRNSGYHFSFPNRIREGKEKYWNTWDAPTPPKMKEVFCINYGESNQKKQEESEQKQGESEQESIKQDEIAIAISLSNDIQLSVEKAFHEILFSRCYCFSFEGGEQYYAAQTGSEATGIAEYIWQQIRKIQREIDVKRIHLFYSGSLEIAAFLGHRLYQVPEIQLYDYDSNKKGDYKYHESFLLIH